MNPRGKQDVYPLSPRQFNTLAGKRHLTFGQMVSNWNIQHTAESLQEDEYLSIGYWNEYVAHTESSSQPKTHQTT